MKLFIRERQCWEQAKHRAMCAIDEQAPFQAILNNRSAVYGQLHADHRALNANVLNDRAPTTNGFKSPKKTRPDLLGPFEQSVFLDSLDHGERRSAGNRIAAERSGVRSRLELLGYIWPGDQRSTG